MFGWLFKGEVEEEEGGRGGERNASWKKVFRIYSIQQRGTRCSIAKP